MNNLLSTYKGLPREIYILFLGKIVNAMGAFVKPLMSLILTQKLGMSAGGMILLKNLKNVND
ncbi:hypothetical protein [Terrisporobacter petrolearius]|uniref:hypothetical protein n=1 Tax=Terrisporobacter petrolearius TaxID=1460447 RepID=UPI0031CC7862